MIKIRDVILGVIGLLSLASPAFAQYGFPYDHLVQARLDGQPTQSGDSIYMQRHDYGAGPNANPCCYAPLGYNASNSVYVWPNAVAQTWSYGPNAYAYNQANGDGGQLVNVWHDQARFWSTQDGSYNGMQYFVGQNCAGTPWPGGWYLFDSRANAGWTSVVAYLAISKNSYTDCPPLGPAYTRFMRGISSFPAQLSGTPTNGIGCDVILTEHYDHADIESSVNMERNWFCYGIGLIYFQAWSNDPNRTPGANLADRCPVITTNGYYYPEDTRYHLMDCRYWMNFVQAPVNFSLRAYGWPWAVSIQ